MRGLLFETYFCLRLLRQREIRWWVIGALPMCIHHSGRLVLMRYILFLSLKNLLLLLLFGF